MKRLPRLTLTLLLAGALALPGAGATLVPSPQPAPVTRSVQTAAKLLTPDEVIVLMNAGRLTDAETAARAASAAHPESARSLLLLARIQARQGRFPEARGTLSRAQTLPQWDEQELGVPFESPGDIEQVMLRDPAAARGLLADVLLAEGDDPKAYYLLAMTEALARQWDASGAALAQARALSPDLRFADPESLASLERALQQQRPPELDGPALALSPWWYAWVAVGVFLAWGALVGFRAFRRYLQAERIRRERRVTEATERATALQAQLDEALRQARQQTGPEAQPLVARLTYLNSQLKQWRQEGLDDLATAAMIQVRYDHLHAAVQTEETFVAYMAEQQAREVQREEISPLAAKVHQGQPSSLRKSERSSWSSGRSSSRRDNSGGSKW
ncbi:tetratricopeptide repeat protein [Deinococcus sp. ME38]|uniref:tetratricopeptide repeat protein n=1 Tax=Deinococcus sp. ME38 TaxID=3400344 RepID=UPI003B5CFCEA